MFVVVVVLLLLLPLLICTFICCKFQIYIIYIHILVVSPCFLAIYISLSYFLFLFLCLYRSQFNRTKQKQISIFNLTTDISIDYIVRLLFLIENRNNKTQVIRVYKVYIYIKVRISNFKLKTTQKLIYMISYDNKTVLIILFVSI